MVTDYRRHQRMMDDKKYREEAQIFAHIDIYYSA